MFHRTQIQNNVAIRGFSKSSLLYTHTNTQANYINDDMNNYLFNVNILPLFNTIKVFLTNFIKSNYTACDNQNNKSVDNGCAQSTIMPHNILNVANLVLHPIEPVDNKNNKFNMNDCSYIQYNCMTKKFSCINALKQTSPSSTKVFLDKNTVTMKPKIISPACCSDITNKAIKDIDYLLTKSTTSLQELPLQDQKVKIKSLSSPKIPDVKCAKMLETTVTMTRNNRNGSGCSSVKGDGNNDKSQHNRRKNRRKNNKITLNNEVNNNTTVVGEKQQIFVAEKKTCKKNNKNRNRNTCRKSNVSEPTPTTKSNADDNKNKNKTKIKALPANQIMCIKSEKEALQRNRKKLARKTNDNTLLHQSNKNDNCFYTSTTTAMFISSFECDRLLSRKEQISNSNSRQRHISDSSDDFICFELSDNEIEPQVIYTDTSNNCVNRWWTNKCDYSNDNRNRWDSTSTDDQDFNEKLPEKKNIEKKVIFVKYV